MTRVVQAAGRLIRSPRDTGVIALFDQRFLHAPYRHHLPPDWLPEEGAGALVGDPAEVAEEFFSGVELEGVRLASTDLKAEALERTYGGDSCPAIVSNGSQSAPDS